MNQETPNKKTKSKPVKATRTGKKSAKAAIAEALKEVEEEAKREDAEQETVTLNIEAQNTVVQNIEV